MTNGPRAGRARWPSMTAAKTSGRPATGPAAQPTLREPSLAVGQLMATLSGVSR